MVVVLNGNGPWPSSNGDKPGLYARFTQAAIAAISVGARGKVATIKAVGNGAAVAGKVYRIKKLKEAEELFGEDNVGDIRFILIGGASEVVISAYAKATDPADETDYLGAMEALETYDFHTFVGPVEFGENYPEDLVTWLAQTKQITKNFMTVFGDDEAEGDVEAIKTSKSRFNSDETVIFVGNGVIEANGDVVPPQLYAQYVAGTIGGTGLAESITNKNVGFAEPSHRYKSIEVSELLEAGILITEIDGDDVTFTQGLTLGEGQYRKIRIVRAKQAMLDDIDRTTKKSYIGKITNHPDGQIAIINGVKQYLTTLASSGVIASLFEVGLDPDYESVGDKLYLLLNVRFLDSIEYVKLTVIARTSDN